MHRSSARRWGFALAFALVGSAHRARAAPPSPPEQREEEALAADERRVAYMDSVLGHFQVESSRYRTWNAALGLARGAASVPIGAVVLSEDFVGSGVLIVASGTLAATSGVLDLLVFRQPFEELRANFLARRRAGESDARIVDETEREWYEKAASVRSGRIRSGLFSLGLGTLLVGVGGAVGVNALSLTSESAASSDRARVASLFLTVGGMNLSAGLRSLLVPDPLESSWQSYTRARSVWGQVRGTMRVQAMALGTGGYVGLSASF